MTLQTLDTIESNVREAIDHTRIRLGIAVLCDEPRGELVSELEELRATMGRIERWREELTAA